MEPPAEDAPLPLPPEPSAPSAALRTGCIAVCGLALLPVLYVGSFVLLLLDEHYEGPVLRSLDESSLGILFTIYLPLIWFCETFLS